MYKIIGGDGNEYGPVSAEQILAWIADNRANGQTKAKLEGTEEWKPLAGFPEFAAVLLAQARATLGQDATSPPPPFASAAAAGPTAMADGDYQLDLTGCITQGWELMKANFGVLFGGFAIYMLIQMAIAGLSAIPIVGAVVQLAGLVITGPLMGGVFYLYLRVLRGEAAEVGDVFAGFRKGFGQLFLGYLVTALFMLLCMLPALVTGFLTVFPALMKQQQPPPEQWLPFGAVALVSIIPIIYLQVSWLFTLPLIIDRELDFWTAMKTSWRRVKLQWWSVFGLLVLTGLLNIVGVLLCCIGLVVTVPIGFVALMVAYETIFSGRNAQNN